MTQDERTSDRVPLGAQVKIVVGTFFVIMVGFGLGLATYILFTPERVGQDGFYTEAANVAGQVIQAMNDQAPEGTFAWKAPVSGEETPPLREMECRSIYGDSRDDAHMFVWNWTATSIRDDVDWTSVATAAVKAGQKAGFTYGPGDDMSFLKEWRPRAFVVASLNRPDGAMLTLTPAGLNGEPMTLSYRSPCLEGAPE